MEDVVDYKIPFAPGFIGTIVNSLIVKDKLSKIFNYRREALKRIFPGKDKD